MPFRLPYPGLRAFTRDESDLFFGRDGCVADMVDRLAATRFLAVLGASGSGKSSLVKTGLLDALDMGLHPAGSAWRICTSSPGGDPFGNLTRGLLADDGAAASPDAHHQLDGFLRRGPASIAEWAKDGNLAPRVNLLLLVDQFEELFRFDGYSEREDAEGFANLLIGSCAAKDVSIHVVITMRSEYLGACAFLPGLAEQVNAGFYLAPRLRRSECEEAIVGPARVTGLTIEPALVTQLLNDIETLSPWSDDPEADPIKRISRRADQLPLMQHVLNRMARLADEGGGGALTLAQYDRLGGLSGALDTHGEEILSALGPARRPMVERLFRALVDGTSPDTATRRPLPLRRIQNVLGESRDDLVTILDVFRADGCNFLRPGRNVPLRDATVVDISHESLIRQWSVLSGWVVEEAHSASKWQQLSDAAHRYANGEGGLLVDLDLANLDNWWRTERPTQEWAARYGGDFPRVSTFLEQSLEADEARKRREAERENREKTRLQQALSVANDNLTLAINATDGLALRVAKKFENNKDIDTAAKLIFIDEIEERFEQMCGGESSNSELLIRKAELLVTNARMLTEVGHVASAATRVEQAQALLVGSRGAELADASNALRAKTSLMMAEVRFHRCEHVTAQAALDGANTALAASADRGVDNATVAARIALLQAQLHDAACRYHDAIAVTGRALHDAQPFLESKDDDPVDVMGSRSTLIEVVGHLHIRRIRTCLTVGIGAGDVLAEATDYISTQFSGIGLSRSGHLRSLMTALLTLETAAHLSREAKHQEALASAHQGVDVLDRLAVKDVGNLATRRALARALLRRAEVSLQAGNLQQAKADVSAARVLAYHLKLDDGIRGVSLFFDIIADYFAGRVAEASGMADAAYTEYRRVTERLTFFEEVFDRDYLGRAYGAVDAWGRMVDGAGVADRIDEITSLLEFRLNLFASEPVAVEDRVFIAHQRYYALARLLDLSPRVVGADRWNRYFDQMMRETSYLAEAAQRSWLLEKCRFIGAKAEFQRELKDLDGALTTYNEAVAAALTVLKSPERNSQALRGMLPYLQRALELTSAPTSETERLIGLLFEFLATVSGDPLAPSEVRLSALECHALSTTVSALRERLADSKASDALLAATDACQARLVEINGQLSVTPPKAVAPSQGAGGTSEAPDLKDIDLGEKNMVDELKQGDGPRINWSAAPLYAATWRTLAGAELTAALNLFVSVGALSLNDIGDAAVRVRTTELDFYDGGRLLDAEVDPPAGPRLISLLVAKDSAPSILDGTSRPIHAINQLSRPLLDTPGRVAGYLRFFCTYVNGEEGSFQLVEHVSDLSWDSTADNRTRQRVAKLLRPLVVWQESAHASDHWNATATVQYSNALFFGLFKIQRDGMVELLEDRDMATDLPVNPTRVTVGRASDSIRRTAAIQGFTSFTDEDFVIHLTRLPVTRRPEQFDLLLREATELAAANVLDDAARTRVSFALLDAGLMTRRALELAEESMRKRKGDPHVMHTLAYGYAKTGRLTEAIGLFEQAAASTDSPKLRAEIFAHLGQAYRLNEDVERATSVLREASAMSLTPNVATFIERELKLLGAGP